MASKTLNWRQRLFLVNFLGKCQGNAEEAARLAGYRYPASTGSSLLQHPIIYAAIQAKLEEAAMTSDEVLARLSDIASGDQDDFLDEVDCQTGADEIGNPIFEKRMRFNYAKAKKRGKTHLIKKMKFDKDGRIEEVELYGAPDALDKLARVHGLYKDKLDIRAAIGDSEEDRRKFVAVFGAIAHLEGAISGGEGWSEGEPGALCHSGLEGSLDACSPSEVIELPPLAGGEEADHAPDDHAGSEAWEE